MEIKLYPLILSNVRLENLLPSLSRRVINNSILKQQPHRNTSSSHLSRNRRKRIRTMTLSPPPRFNFETSTNPSRPSFSPFLDPTLAWTGKQKQGTEGFSSREGRGVEVSPSPRGTERKKRKEKREKKKRTAVDPPPGVSGDSTPSRVAAWSFSVAKEALASTQPLSFAPTCLPTPSLHGASSIRGSLHFRGHVAAGSVSLSHSSAAAPALSRVRAQDTRSLLCLLRFWRPPVSPISPRTRSRPGRPSRILRRPLTIATFRLSTRPKPWTTTRSREPFSLPPPSRGRGWKVAPSLGEKGEKCPRGLSPCWSDDWRMFLDPSRMNNCWTIVGWVRSGSARRGWLMFDDVIVLGEGWIFGWCLIVCPFWEVEVDRDRRDRRRRRSWKRGEGRGGGKIGRSFGYWKIGNRAWLYL